MKHYDEIVVGSGISGMVLALLLAKNNKSVLLIEKASAIGGSMARYKKQGVPFDTGFHFTGGLGADGLLTDMLKVLDIEDDIQPVALDEEGQNTLVFEDDSTRYSFQSGLEQLKEQMVADFPEEAEGLTYYFDRVKEICVNTSAMNLRTISQSDYDIDEDYISFTEEISKYISSPRVKALLSHYSFCYGVSPDVISFANHSRSCYSLYEATTRIKGGGGSFVDALEKQLRKYNVEIRTQCFINQCCDVENKEVGRFELNDGDSVSAEHCTFTIHPKEILKTLDGVKLTKAFKQRVDAFEPSLGFFTVFATANDVDDFKDSIVQFFPDNDVHKMFDSEHEADRPIVVTSMSEDVNGKRRNIINAFEVSFASDVEQWDATTSADRPEDYLKYKEKRTTQILKRIYAQFPQYEGKLEIVDTASLLTFKEYLNSPYGCAYGIAQKMGQFNLFGRLPLKNLYAAGQSALLPGMLGAMFSSFIIGRILVGHEEYQDFINSFLDESSS